MSTYVLIHGSLIGGWCWNKVKTILENDGHIVYAPDLPGHSKDDKISAKEITLNKYVSFVCNLINGIDGKVILVGHSLGGAIITNAVEYVHNKIEKLVYVCAIVPKNEDKVGELLKSCSVPETNNPITINKFEMHIEVNFDKVNDVLFNGCDKDDIAYAIKMMVPQPFIPFTEPIIIKQENFKKINRIGVVCTEDRSLPPVFQEKMYNDAGCKMKFIKSGHAPYFSKAKELSKILLDCL
jgi:pimeloyl-ACP methyl ester carboxylesterase